jgi:anti-anti-sigma factor
MAVTSVRDKPRSQPVDSFFMTSSFSDTGSREGHHSSFADICFKGGVLTITPAGPKLTEREATAISADLRPAMAQHMKKLRKIVLDLSGVAMMTSFGLGMCVEIRNTADALGVRTIISGLNPQLDEMIRMLKIDRLFTITHSTDELFKALAA